MYRLLQSDCGCQQMSICIWLFGWTWSSNPVEWFTSNLQIGEKICTIQWYNRKLPKVNLNEWLADVCPSCFWACFLSYSFQKANAIQFLFGKRVIVQSATLCITRVYYPLVLSLTDPKNCWLVIILASNASFLLQISITGTRSRYGTVMVRLLPGTPKVNKRLVFSMLEICIQACQFSLYKGFACFNTATEWY